MEAKKEAPAKKRANRSPAYPAHDLQRAVELLEQLYEHAHFHLVPAGIAVTSIGYSPSSGNGQRAIAALNHFGLLEEEGSGKDRRVKLSDLGKRIAVGRATESGDYYQALKEAALKPAIYKQIWDQWEGKLPADSVIKHHLVLERGFNRNVVDDVIQGFHKTIQFASLAKSGVNSGSSGERRLDTAPIQADAPPETPRKPEDALMSALNLTSQETQVVAIPLFSGKHVIINIPKPLSETDYDFMVKYIDVMLTGMKPQIVGSGSAASKSQPTSDQDA